MSKDDSTADDSAWLDEILVDVTNICNDCEHPRCLQKLKSARKQILAHTKREVAAARLDEAKIWNQMCHDRDIERITHDYYVKQRDDRIDRLETQLKAAQPDTGGGGDTR